MDIYHRFCVIVSLIQKQTNRIWELHYTLKITKPWNYLDHLGFTCLIAMVGTSTGHSILIVLWSPLAETATYIAYTQFWWQWQCNGMARWPSSLSPWCASHPRVRHSLQRPSSPISGTSRTPCTFYIIFCAAQHWGKLKISSQLKKKHVLGENLLQPPHLPHSTFNLPSSKKPPDTGYHGCNQGHLENRISLFMIGSLHDNWQFCALRTWLSSRKDWWEKLLVALLANHHPARPDHHPSQELNTILTSGLTVRQWSWSLAWKSTDLYLYRWFMSEIRHHDRGRK